jgi:hypothetical protein
MQMRQGGQGMGQLELEALIKYRHYLSWFRQLGQYQGAGVFTGFGLLLRHLAQR